MFSLAACQSNEPKDPADWTNPNNRRARPYITEEISSSGAAANKANKVYGLKLDRMETCEKIAGSFGAPKAYIQSAQSAKAQFTLIKDLRSVSKSGAFPSLVKNVSDQKVKFLKIFPSIKRDKSGHSIVDNASFLEIFNSCRLANLKSFGANLQPDVSASVFFTDVYESGFLTTIDPFAGTKKDKNNLYPYLLAEAVDNVTLTKLVTEPNKVSQKDSLGFNIKTAPPMVLESILLQILVALKNAHLALELTHNDLHTGNILLAKNAHADFYIDFQGKKMQLEGPLVKIIDFGLGNSKDYPQKNSVNFSLWVKNRPVIKELEDFIKALRPTKGIKLTTRARIYLDSDNQDIAMFNLILRAMKKELLARNKKLPKRTYCNNYDDCLALLSQWWPS